MDFLMRLSLFFRQQVRKLLGWSATFEERRDWPEYAGLFVADSLDRLEILTQDYIYVSGQPVALQVTDVDVRSTAVFQVIDVSLLAQRASDVAPSDDVKIRFPRELTWQVSPEPSELVRVELPESFYYTFTSERSVEENASALVDYIQRQFNRDASAR